MSESPPKTQGEQDGNVQSPVVEGGDMSNDQNEIYPEGYDQNVKEQDRWLPIANVARIMKLALPDNAKIAKEAKECMQECVSEFISFITSEASEKCQQEKRKTVNGEDILFAMTSLGFENYAEALKIYLSKYRETQSARGEQAQRPGSSDQTTGFGTTAGPSGSVPAANFGDLNNAMAGGPYGMGGDHDAGVGPSQYAMGPAVTNGTNSY